MPQYKYILFKDGKPWKGMFNEVDFINEYDHTYQGLFKQVEEKLINGQLAEDIAIAKFFKRFHPAMWDPSIKGYRSLLREYILGANEDEGSVVYGIDWEDLNLKHRCLFEFREREFGCLLDHLNRIKRFEKPMFGVTRGTGVLSML